MRPLLRKPSTWIFVLVLLSALIMLVEFVDLDDFEDDFDDEVYQATNYTDFISPQMQHLNIQVEIDEDQDEVFYAVQAGLIRPFSDLYTVVEREINGRIIQVELDDDEDEYDNDIWVYNIKVLHQDNVIRIKYNATTLKMLTIKGRNVQQVLKQPMQK